jgi:hypothetical protein
MTVEKITWDNGRTFEEDVEEKEEDEWWMRGHPNGKQCI